MNDFPDVRALIARNDFEIHFQPVASVRRRNILGVEALCRGREGAALIAPDQLFSAAQTQNLGADLDRACQTEALSRFAPLPGTMPNVSGVQTGELMLFVNLHPDSIADGRCASKLERMVTSAGLNPNRVVIEVLESHLEESAARRTTLELRQAGFLVALDDIGAGSSNLDRIAMLRPDILKADRGLIHGLHRDYHKREVFKALVVLSEKIGGWIVAEGVEELDEALCVLELGGDLMQGYFFARPQRLERIEALNAVDQVAHEFKQHMLTRVRENRRRHDQRLAALHDLRAVVTNCPPPQWEANLCTRLPRHPEIESACLLDKNGLQITETLMGNVPFEANKASIFAPPTRGSDHSYKEYFYLLREGQIDPFATSPYVPLPSGDLCVTLTTQVHCALNELRVLVVHFKIGN